MTGRRRAPAPKHATTHRRPAARARVVHGVARVVLDAAATVGIVCALTAVGLLLAGWRPVVLVSGSMSPGLPTGTLVIARPVPAGEVAIGDVVTVPVPGSAARVTHRVTGLSSEDGITWASLRGDANDVDDAAAYPLAGTVLRAAASFPGLGRVVTGSPAAVLIAGAAALVVVALLPGRGPDREGRGAPTATPVRADPFPTTSRRAPR